MKKLYSCFILSFFICNSFSQITFEHTYNNVKGKSGGAYVFHTTSGLFYYTVTIATPWPDARPVEINVYDQNHAFTQTIPVNGEILYVTDKLFDSDDEIELVVKRSRAVTSPTLHYTNDIVVIDNLGNTIYIFADRFYAHLTKNSTGDIKFIVDSPGSFGFTSEVYGVNGTLSVEQETYLDKQILGFPIPTENILTISNIITNGGETNLEIYDSSGKQVLKKTLFISEPEINIDVSSLQNGTYICRYNSKTIKFVKK